jgi:DNA-binding LytR/AlgR family response regulator
VQRSQVRYVEAHGDYARLHTATSSHLVRVPLTTLEERWADAGFVRIHRSTLVALPHVDEIRVDGGRCAVRLGDKILQVSRRHTKELRDKLVRATSLSREQR